MMDSECAYHQEFPRRISFNSPNFLETGIPASRKSQTVCIGIYGDYNTVRPHQGIANRTIRHHSVSNSGRSAPARRHSMHLQIRRTFTPLFAKSCIKVERYWDFSVFVRHSSSTSYSGRRFLHRTGWPVPLSAFIKNRDLIPRGIFKNT
jgi:hypothetical protein